MHAHLSVWIDKVTAILAQAGALEVQSQVPECY